ncbi:glycosyltransferase family 2 protein [Meridianimarinicoccus sp. RP-17]|uniref:glycosyltransferase family 2 protein n=1 Tax=Meridianimarinicoccus zhengii TaxID=2056810 RepID=UPI000DAB6F3B|nr:glycosyltransferase [Phycocomes zhengii]
MPQTRHPVARRLRAAVVARIVPRGGHGHTLLSRLFLRTSGAPRAGLPDPWQASVRQRLLVNWLTDVQGIPVTDGHVAVDPPWDGAETCPRAVIAQDRQTGAMVLRDRDAAAIAGGMARLTGALADSPDAAVAYGDAICADADGRVAGHWLKAPRPDPLLVAQGLLLHGLVAVAKDAPGSAALLAALRGGATLQAAMVHVADGIPADRLVHCAAPVAVCAPPRPLPMGVPNLPDPLPVVSILIPTRNAWDLLGPCLASLRGTDWPRDRMEILVIDNGSDDPETLAELGALAAAGQITLLRDDGAFNFARLNNAGARAARGDLLVLLNNDTTARDPGWLRTLAAHALRPGIGAVGCKLLYPDGDVQHAGVALGIRGGAQHVFVGLRADDPGYNHLAAVDRSVTAVTAACLAVTRAAFDAVGGLREDLAVSYNDVVFCADLMAAGHRNVCVASPLFVHHESRSRGKDTDRAKRDRHRAERARAIALHPDLFAQDPFYSAHLSRKVDHALLLA